MNEIDKTFSDLLKSNINLGDMELQTEEVIMKGVYERSQVEEKLEKLRKRSLFVLKVAAAALIIVLISLYGFANQSMTGEFTVFHSMICLLGFGLFYLMLTMHLTFSLKK